MASSANANSRAVFVDSKSGPWNVAVNPSYYYGDGVVGGGSIAATSVDSSSGIPFLAGDSLTISYLNGFANGGGWGIYNDANGANPWWQLSI